MALLSLIGVTKNFDGFSVLKGVELEVNSGEILGLIGPNGAGKTTLFHLISGVLKPSGGEIKLSGVSLHPFSVAERAKKFKMARTFQVTRTFAELTCAENVEVALNKEELSRSWKEDQIHFFLNRAGLAGRAKQEARHLTLMEKKRLELARALATEPQILLLDELMSGLNPTEVNEAILLIQNLNQEAKLTIFWIEHLIRAVAQTSHRLAALIDGKIIDQGAPTEVLKNPRVMEAYLGASHV